jgi:hypothetical protein
MDAWHIMGRSFKRLHPKARKDLYKSGPTIQTNRGVQKINYTKRSFMICTHQKLFRGFKSRMRWVGHVTRMGERRGIYRGLVGRPDGNRPLGRPRRRWGDDIKMNLQEVTWGGMDWIDLVEAKDRWRARVNAVMNLRVS